MLSHQPNTIAVNVMTESLPDRWSTRSFDVYDLMSQWISSFRGSDVEADGRTVQRWLQSTGNDRENLDGCLSRAVVTSLSCTIELAHWLTLENQQVADDRLKDWHECVTAFQRSWASDAKTDWGLLLTSFDHPARRVLEATIAKSLWECVSSCPAPADVCDAVERLGESGQAWCRGFPVPPWRGRSLVAAHYVQRHRNAEITRPAQNLLPDLSDWDDIFLNDLVDSFKGAPDNSRSLDLDVAIIAAVRDELAPALREFLVGWPIEAKRLLDSVRRLLDVLTSSSAETIESIPEIKRLVAVLDPVGCALKRAMRQTSGESDTRESISHPAEGGDEASSLRESLRQITHWLSRQNDPCSEDYTRVLTSIAAQQSGDLQSCASDVLNLVSDIDALLAESSSRSETVVGLRERLRKLLIERFHYVILDTELLGRPFGAVRDRVTVYRRVPSSSLPSNHIIQVHRPGYMHQFSDGQLRLITPAEVVVSK